MLWARFITSITREMGYKNYPTRIYLTRTQARSWTHCSSGCDIVLATRQGHPWAHTNSGIVFTPTWVTWRGLENFWTSTSLVLRLEAVTWCEGGCGRGIA